MLMEQNIKNFRFFFVLFYISMFSNLFAQNNIDIYNYKGIYLLLNSHSNKYCFLDYSKTNYSTVMFDEGSFETKNDSIILNTCSDALNLLMDVRAKNDEKQKNNKFIINIYQTDTLNKYAYLGLFNTSYIVINDIDTFKLYKDSVVNYSKKINKFYITQFIEHFEYLSKKTFTKSKDYQNIENNNSFILNFETNPKYLFLVLFQNKIVLKENNQLRFQKSSFRMNKMDVNDFKKQVKYCSCELVNPLHIPHILQQKCLNN